MSQHTTDRNLLFGILAIQLDLVSRDALIAAMNSWVLEKTKSLGQILVEHNALHPHSHTLLASLVETRLSQEGEELAKEKVAATPATLSTPPDAAVGGAVPETKSLSVGKDTSSGRFRILRPHARGGIGEVSIARDEELHREVALKELQLPHAFDPEGQSRFVLEARITGRLEHPGIVPIYGLGAHGDGRPYYAMRLIKGETLRETIHRFHLGEGFGPAPGERLLARNRLLRRFISVCDAVHYAHSRGVVHRDIKPGNIMLGPYGETLLVDWGLAKLLTDDHLAYSSQESTLGFSLTEVRSTATRPGSFVGTPQYASPEQAAGRAEEVGPGSDIYSLGATLYTILTNHSPFEHDNVQVLLEQVSQGQFSRPSQVNKHVPKLLEVIGLKAMALDRVDRYATARELGEDVERFLSNEPLLATPVASGKPAEPCRLRVSVHDSNGVLFRAAALSGVLELGRQMTETEQFPSIIPSAETQRIVVVPLDEAMVSRKQARLEVREGRRVLLKNISGNCPLRIRGMRELNPGEERMLALPFVLQFRAERSVLVESDDGRSLSELIPESAGLEGSGLTPSLSELSLPGNRDPLVPDQFLEWMHAIIHLTASGSNRNELFDNTARCVLNVVQLDVAAVLLHDENGWEVQATQFLDASHRGAVHPSLYVLERLLQEKRAMWQTPTQEEEGAAASIRDMCAIVAAPILDPQQRVVGAIYGERSVTTIPTSQSTRVEGLFLTLVAALVGARLG